MTDEKPKSRSKFDLIIQKIIKNLKSMRSKTFGKQRLFCPPNMVRCDNFLPYFQHYTVWACKICKTFLLNKKSAMEHANQCKPIQMQKDDIPIGKRGAMAGSTVCYSCRFCDKTFEIGAARLGPFLAVMDGRKSGTEPGTTGNRLPPLLWVPANYRVYSAVDRRRR